MHPLLQLVIAACVIALTWALVVVLLQLRRTAARAEGVLDLVEREIRPMAGQMEALAEEVRGLLKQTRGEVARLSAIATQIEDLGGKVSRVVAALAGFTRVGQAVGLASGLRRGVDAFASRIKSRGR